MSSTVNEMYSSWCIAHCVKFSTWCTIYCVMYSSWCIIHCVMYSTWCTVYCVMYSSWCIIHFVMCSTWYDIFVCTWWTYVLSAHSIGSLEQGFEAHLRHLAEGRGWRLFLCPQTTIDRCGFHRATTIDSDHTRSMIQWQWSWSYWRYAFISGIELQHTVHNTHKHVRNPSDLSICQMT